MNILAKDASKKEDRIFRGVSHILALVEKMIAANPDERPGAKYVQERIHNILTEYCGMGNQGVSDSGQNKESKGRIHCESRRIDETNFNFGFDQLRLASQRAAADACATVNPSGAEPRVLGVNGGIIYGMERDSITSQGGMSGYSSGSGIGGVAMGRIRSGDVDKMSVATKSSKNSSEGKSKSSGSLGGSAGQGKVKPKAKAWQAPVYAELSFG